jgi:hypothetical protein
MQKLVDLAPSWPRTDRLVGFALAFLSSWPRNGRKVTFSLFSVQIPLVFEVAHGVLSTGP